MKDNKPMISFGGGLIRSLLSDGSYICLNNHNNTSGGPWTQVDPADLDIKSCLDLVIISTNLLPYFVSMAIDSARKFSHVRASNKKEYRYFHIIVQFKNIGTFLLLFNLS